MTKGQDPVQIKTERFKNQRWGILCCCCGQRVAKGSVIELEIREDATSHAETEWLYTRHYLCCPSSARPHGFDVHLARAIINLTDNLGTFQLDKVVASSPTDRRASTLSLPEIVHACTESLRLLGGDGSCEDSSNHSLHRRQIGNTSHRRIEAAAAAATDPASFLEDVAAEASSGLEEGGGALRDAHRRLRVKRAVCKATIDALFLRRPSVAGQLLTTKPGSLVALPSPQAPAAEAAPIPPRRFPRRVRFAPLASSGGATATSEAEHLVGPPAAATLLDTCPPPPPRPFPRRVAFTPMAISDGAATSEAQRLEESPAARLLDTCPPPARGELFADEEDAKNLRSLADSHMARKAMWPPLAAACNKQEGRERGKSRIAKENEKWRLA